MNLWF